MRNYRRFISILAVAVFAIFTYFPLVEVLAQEIINNEPEASQTENTQQQEQPVEEKTPEPVKEEPKAEPVVEPAVEPAPAVEQPAPEVTPETAPATQPEEQPAAETPKEEQTTPTKSEKITNNDSVTYTNIKINEAYTSLEDAGAAVTFTKLPENLGPITLNIKKIIVSSEVNAEQILSSAYQFTTNPELQDGTFTADITLKLNKRLTDEDKVNVQYSEDGINYHLQKTDSIDNPTDKITFTTNHFTIFVITDDDASYPTGVWNDNPTQGYNDNGIHYPITPGPLGFAVWDLGAYPGFTPGNYFVYVSWSTGSNRATSAPYRLDYNGTPLNIFDDFTFDINQRRLANQTTVGTSGQFSGWYSVGQFDLNSDSKMSLRTVLNISGNNRVIADEVLLIPTTPPTVNEKKTKDTTPAITGTIPLDDDNNPTVVTVTVNGNSYPVNTDGAGNWTLANNVISPALAEGTYDVSISYTNMGGTTRTDESSDELIIDLTAPNIPTVISPLDGDFIKPNQAVFDWTDESDPGAVSDPVSYDFRIRPQGGSFTNYNDLPTSDIDQSTYGYSDGVYIWRVRACDTVGNCSNYSSPSQITIDGTKPKDPKLFLSDPIPGLWTQDNTIELIWPTPSSPKGAKDNLSGVDGYSYSFSQNDTELPDKIKDLEEEETEVGATLDDGVWYFNLRTVDNAGNWTHTAHFGPFLIDTTKPEVDITKPESDSSVKGVFKVKGHAYDYGSGIKDVRVRVRRMSDNSLVNTFWATYNSGNNKWSVDIDSYNLIPGDGLYKIVVRARDFAGQTKFTNVINIEVDNTAPETPVQISPIDGAIIKPSDAIFDWSDVTDPDSGEIVTTLLGSGEDVTYDFRIRLQGETFVKYNNLTESEINLTDPSLPDGIYEWKVRACDALNNCSDYSPIWTVTIDGTAPQDPTDFETDPLVNVWTKDNTVWVNWPEVDATGGASDNLSGVDGYSYTFTQGATDLPDDAKDLEETDTEITSSALADGFWYFHLRTVDNAGNWTSTQHIGPFKIDTTKPVISFTSPANNSTWPSNIGINGVGSDNNFIDLLKIEVKVSGSSTWATIYTNGNGSETNPLAFNRSWNPGLENNYQIKVTATDPAGNTRSVTRNVTYNVPDTGTTTPQPTNTGNNNGNNTGGNPTGQGDVLGEETEFSIDLPSSEFNLETGESFVFSIEATGRDMEDLTCTWDFGDGTVVKKQKGADSNQDHAYDKAGEYNVTVTCTDKDGKKTSTTSTVTVTKPEDNGGDEGSVQGDQDNGDETGDEDDKKSIVETIKNNALLCVGVPLLLALILLLLFLARRRRDQNQ